LEFGIFSFNFWALSRFYTVKMSLKGLIFFFHDWHENWELSKGLIIWSLLSRRPVVATTTKPNLGHLAPASEVAGTSEAKTRCPRFGLVVVATTSRRDDKDQMIRPLDNFFFKNFKNFENVILRCAIHIMLRDFFQNVICTL
jgi:hypothetical protein